MLLLDIGSIAFSVWGYPVSYLELLATSLGLLSVFLASRENIATWPTGILSEIAFFYLFFQVSLYAGMLLQVIFFVITLAGWYGWHKGKPVGKIQQLNPVVCLIILITAFALTFLFNQLIQQLPSWFPHLISKPAAQSWIDSWVAVTSVIAVILLAKKYIFSWVLWILVDLVSIYLFWNQALYLLAVEYCIFLMMAIYGYLNWRKLIAE